MVQFRTSDESTPQILSYGLLFLTFYHFPYTADPLTCTMLMQPYTTFAWSPSTIPYTHCTISLAPHCRSFIWLMDHIVLFPFLVPFLLPNMSCHGLTDHKPLHHMVRTFTIHFTTHEPCAHFTYHLYLRLLYLLWKKRMFSPELRLKFISSHCFTLLHLRTFVSSLYFILPTPFILSHHSEPLSHTISYSLILRQETISLLQNCTPQNHIWYTLRSPISTDLCCILGTSVVWDFLAFCCHMCRCVGADGVK